MQFSEIKEKCIHITPKTKIFFPLTGETKQWDVRELSPAYRMRFAHKNGVIAFIDESHNCYILPTFKDFIKVFKGFGYTLAQFHVPSSELESYPLKEKARWDELIAEMQSTQ